jgi:hypothetical protein
MQDLGKLLTRDNVERAIKYVDQHKPKLNKGKLYAIKHNGKLYPPKEIARYAVDLDNSLPADKRTAYRVQGGPKKINKWFSKLEFDVTDTFGKPVAPEPHRNWIARLTFNTENWTEPTGVKGKSKRDHEGKYGYGHEEWLFDLSKLIDGYHYGFVEAFRKKADVYVGDEMNIRFFTLDAQNKKRYWAGQISRLEIIDPELGEKIKQEYKVRGWLDKMNDQIKEVQRQAGIKVIGLSNYKNLQLFNVRFRAEALDQSSIGRPIPQSSGLMAIKRYSLVEERPDLLLGLPVIPMREILDAQVNARTSTTYTHSKESVEMRFIHEQMSMALANKLRGHYRPDVVIREDKAGFDGREIDISVKNDSKIIYFEIKTNLTLAMAIRAAIGQLMEYCHWPEEMRADHWVIVTQPFIDTKAAERYLVHLRNLYKLPIYLQTFDYLTDKLTELLPHKSFHGENAPKYFL